jgi:hypothetical protein
MHMAPWQTAKQDFVRSLARYEPDLVIDTGDNLGHIDGIRGVERALGTLRRDPGRLRPRIERLPRPGLKNPLRYFVTTEDSRSGR